MRDEAYAELMSAAEAMLFVSDEPASSAKLATMIGVAPGKMDEALALLAAEYQDENRGIQLREVAGGWRFFTHPAHHELIEKYIVSWDTRKLSQAALETLAIIAYHQPVTRANVNAVRGVNSEGVVSSLVEKGLVREMGRDSAPGNAILYGTTRTFLERFGLKSVQDLPPLEDFAPDDESREYIRDRLSGNDATTSAQLGFEAQEDAEYLDDAQTESFDETETAVVEDVDYGDEEREDDPQTMADIIDEAMTEKVEIDYADDDDFDNDEDEDDVESEDTDDDEDDEEDIPIIE